MVPSSDSSPDSSRFCVDMSLPPRHPSGFGGYITKCHIGRMNTRVIGRQEEQRSDGNHGAEMRESQEKHRNY